MGLTPLFKRILSLVRAGVLPIDIAKKLGVTRQNISERLNRYYAEREVYRDEILVKKCKVCDTEEYIVTKILISKLKSFKLTPKYKKERYICPLCEANHLHRCPGCGVVGYETEFIFNTVDGKKKVLRCKKCNCWEFKKWKDKNKERAKEIYTKFRKSHLGYWHKYQNTYRKKNKAEGVCIRCGKEKDNPSLNYCKTCRDKTNANSNKIYEKRKNLGLCPRCGKEKGATTVSCPACLKERKLA